MTIVTISFSTSQIFRSWVAVFQQRPPRASLFRSSYDMPWLAPRTDALSWGQRDFHISFSNGDIRRETLEIVIEEVLWSIRGSYQSIWSFPLTNVKWHSVTWPYTMKTPYWSDFVPNLTFYRILSGFNRTFATGVACRQGRLLPHTPGPVLLLRPILFPNLLLFFQTMLFEYPSVLSRFCSTFISKNRSPEGCYKFKVLTQDKSKWDRSMYLEEYVASRTRFTCLILWKLYDVSVDL